MSCLVYELCFLMQVNENFPFPISLSWKGAAADTQNGAAEGPQTTIVIPKGSPIPCLKAVTILRSGTLTVDVHYADVSELQAPAKISSYTVSNIPRQFVYATLINF